MALLLHLLLLLTRGRGRTASPRWSPRRRKQPSKHGKQQGREWKIERNRWWDYTEPTKVWTDYSSYRMGVPIRVWCCKKLLIECIFPRTVVMVWNWILELFSISSVYLCTPYNTSPVVLESTKFLCESCKRICWLFFTRMLCHTAKWDMVTVLKMFNCSMFMCLRAESVFA